MLVNIRLSGVNVRQSDIYIASASVMLMFEILCQLYARPSNTSGETKFVNGDIILKGHQRDLVNNQNC